MSSPSPDSPFAGQMYADHSREVIGCAAAMISLASLMVALRFYVKAKILHSVTASDWLILASWAIFLSSVFFHLSFASARSSILLSCLHHLAALARSSGSKQKQTYKYARRATKILLSIVIIAAIWFFTIQMTRCIPLHRIWDFSAEGVCLPDRVWQATDYLHMALNFLVLFMGCAVSVVISRAEKRSMMPGSKVGLSLVLGIGFIVCIFSTLIAIWKWELLSSGYWQRIYDSVDTSKWIAVELNLAIVCACLLTLGPIWRAIPKYIAGLGIRNLKNSNSSHGHGSGSGTGKSSTVGGVIGRTSSGDLAESGELDATGLGRCEMPVEGGYRELDGTVIVELDASGENNARWHDSGVAGDDRVAIEGEGPATEKVLRLGSERAEGGSG